MTELSVFDMFKIGIGPSSSHTMGPWLAAQRFLEELPTLESSPVCRVQVELFGSLAKTGKGHGTDIAVQLGLCGHQPKTIDVTKIDDFIQEIARTQSIALNGVKPILFNSTTDIVFHFDTALPFHPNGIRFKAWGDSGEIASAEFYSIGGGFIVRQDEESAATATSKVNLPFPIEAASDLLAHCERESLKICEVVKRNEQCWRDEAHVRNELEEIKNAMFASAHRGCLTAGILPGGLNVKRRAAQTAAQLLGSQCDPSMTEWLKQIKAGDHGFQNVTDWVSCFALAVNEENAAFGRVVTAPTNGAAGVIPAVLLYFVCFCEADDDACIDFLLTAAEIGCIFKKGATISAALGGCQAEIGVSSAMAAAALAEGLGGSPGQAAEAAEIAMEHHLGMTCDPIGGLVQIPCIERNAMGAIKAITAAQMSLHRDPSEARVPLDAAVRTMWKTALDMDAKYKETSEGGLAMQIPVNVIEC